MSRNSQTCKFCHKVGHAADDCPKRPHPHGYIKGVDEPPTCDCSKPGGRHSYVCSLQLDREALKTDEDNSPDKRIERLEIRVSALEARLDPEATAQDDKLAEPQNVAEVLDRAKAEKDCQHLADLLDALSDTLHKIGMDAQSLKCAEMSGFLGITADYLKPE